MSVSASVVSGQLATFDLHKENHTHKNVEDNEITAQIAACNIFINIYILIIIILILILIIYLVHQGWVFCPKHKTEWISRPQKLYVIHYKY